MKPALIIKEQMGRNRTTFSTWMPFTIFKEEFIPMPLYKAVNNGPNIVLSLQWSIEMSLPFQLFTLPIEVMNLTTIWLTSLKKAIPMLPYYLSFRVVRFKLTQDTYEVLLTNLPEDEFSVSELKELYAMRWALKPLSEIWNILLLCLISTLKNGEYSPRSLCKTDYAQFCWTDYLARSR